MHTDDFRRLFVDFVMVDTLVAMLMLDKKWHAVVEKKLTELEVKLDEPFGEVIVLGGNEVWYDGYESGYETNPDEREETMEVDYTTGGIIFHEHDSESDEEWVRSRCKRKERMKQVTTVVFLLNITKVGDHACAYASNLVVVDIPEGITSIGERSFTNCISLKDISFPKSLRSIGTQAFPDCSSLEKVDLLHTNVEYLGEDAFWGCTSLREFKVPDSLQKFGSNVFWDCSKLVPSDISTYDVDAVITYLRSIQ
ncbi:hypothetical protein TrCOL_g11857 [Triparma columacea]|uniref:Uncharacterized protein n=1 Tax=Triparma columacea TaxID=722753 RepID=A0A9W7G302_9STRA|nr:hypothetical protein TrCOL_g11857 [Triparma columacea]